MTKVLGVDVLVKSGGEILGSQRDANLSVSGKEIDVSDKTTGGWDTFLTGNRAWEISCDCIALEIDPGQEDIIDKSLEGEQVETVFAHGEGKVFVGEATITNMELTGPKDDVSTASFTLKGASALAVEKSPTFVSAVLSGLDKIVTITMSETVLSNAEDAAALKAAVTVATDGSTYAALAEADSVAVTDGKLVVTFDSALTTATNKIKIAARTLKSTNGAIQLTEQETSAIDAS